MSNPLSKPEIKPVKSQKLRINNQQLFYKKLKNLMKKLQDLKRSYLKLKHKNNQSNKMPPYVKLNLQLLLNLSMDYLVKIKDGKSLFKNYINKQNLPSEIVFLLLHLYLISEHLLLNLDQIYGKINGFLIFKI